MIKVIHFLPALALMIVGCAGAKQDSKREIASKNGAPLLCSFAGEKKPFLELKGWYDGANQISVRFLYSEQFKRGMTDVGRIRPNTEVRNMSLGAMESEQGELSMDGLVYYKAHGDLDIQIRINDMYAKGITLRVAKCMGSSCTDEERDLSCR